MFPKKPSDTLVWAVVAAWGLSAAWPLAADIRSGANVIITAEALDSGGGLIKHGLVVTESTMGGAGGQSTGNTVVMSDGYSAQVPELPLPLTPTAAVLLSFDARWLGTRTVVLEWETGVEYDLLGFQVERQTSTSDWVRVHGRIIHALGDGRPNRYKFVDSNVPDASQARYRLLAVNLSGHLDLMSEITAQVVLQASIVLTPTGLMISVRAPGSGRAIVETTADVAHGPWVPSAELNLDADGNGMLPASLHEEGPARFYRIRQD